MSKLERQLAEDRKLRNSARRLFDKELARVKTEITPEALGERVADDIGSRAEAASDKAIGFVESNRGTIIAGIGAVGAGIGLWIARAPLLSGIKALFMDDGAEGESGRENPGYEDPDNE